MVEITPRDTTLAEIREDTVRLLCGIVHFTFLLSHLVLCISIVIDCSIELIFSAFAPFRVHFLSSLPFLSPFPSFLSLSLILIFIFLSCFLLRAIDMIDG